MADWLASNYLTLKSLHLVAVVAWVGTQLSIPFLVQSARQQSLRGITLNGQLTAGRQIIRIVMNPAMLVALVMGFGLAGSYGLAAARETPWLAWKIGLVVGMTVAHGMTLTQFSHLEQGERVSPFGPWIALALTMTCLVGIAFVAVYKPL